jgi:pyruvate kinase
VVVINSQSVLPDSPFVAVVDGYDQSLLPILDQAAAIVASNAGWTSDIAVYALSRKIPAVVGVQDATQKLKSGQIVTVDPVRGVIYLGKTQV